MNYKSNRAAYEQRLQREGIHTLYHFTDRDNLASIIRHGGLYAWYSCEQKGIQICKAGGGQLSRDLDRRDGLEDYVRVSFVKNHPMQYVAMNDGRISNPVLLEIDPEVICWEGSLYADRNATKTGACVGAELSDLEAIHFNAIKARNHFDLDPDEQPFFQAEVLVKSFIPLKYIRNIGDFGIKIPSQPDSLQAKDAYTAQISRKSPTAFIFIVDQSASMSNTCTFNGESIPMSEAVARIVNNQLNELVLRCIKADEVRHYYDIALIGYGREVQSAWQGMLSGRDFVSPEEIKNNPYKTIKVQELKRTRRGEVMKEVEKVQWLEANDDGGSTYTHLAFAKAKALLEAWLDGHKQEVCYPPTVIHITDGEYNGCSDEEIKQVANEIKSLQTKDGNVLLFNIHISNTSSEPKSFPTDKHELDDSYGKTLCELSSLLPYRYNVPIAKMKGHDSNDRHYAMAMNADMSTLIQLMDIGTPTNISQSK